MTKSEKFENFIVKYQDLVYSICYKMLSDSNEAENIVQESYLSLYKNFDSYMEFEDNHIKNLICKIALNKCKDILKSARYQKVVATDIAETFDNKYDENEDIEENLFINERKKLILKMINDLKEPYKSVIYEYYINQRSIDEVSKKLDTPKATIKIQLYRAKKILKENIISIKGGDVF